MEDEVQRERVIIVVMLWEEGINPTPTREIRKGGWLGLSEGQARDVIGAPQA